MRARLDVFPPAFLSFLLRQDCALVKTGIQERPGVSLGHTRPEFVRFFISQGRVPSDTNDNTPLVADGMPMHVTQCTVRLEKKPLAMVRCESFRAWNRPFFYPDLQCQCITSFV